MVYYEHQPAPDEDKPPGCLDVIAITGAIFAALLIPLIMIIVVIGGVIAALLLFFQHPALALIPIGLIAIGAWAFARWDSTRERPPPDLP